VILSKLALNPPQFWDFSIFLPPLAERRRVMARIEEREAKIEAPQSLPQSSVTEAEALMVTGITRALQGTTSASCLADGLLEQSTHGCLARGDKAENGIPLLALGDDRLGHDLRGVNQANVMTDETLDVSGGPQTSSCEESPQSRFSHKRLPKSAHIRYG
jgi:hypothetical protein